MELAQHDWVPYFRSITGEQRRLLVAIESMGRSAPIEERIDAMCGGVCTRHPLRAISYEHHADVLEVAVGLANEQGPLLRYFVAAPRAIVVTDAGGARTLVCVFSIQPRDSRTAALVHSVDRNHVPRRQAPEAVHAIASAGRRDRQRHSVTARRNPRPELDCASRRHR
jgi:hypothetical protein